MADIHGSPGNAPQMPGAPNAGPAPVPYGGADLSPEPPIYGAADLGADAGGASSAILDGVTGLNTTESAAAHDLAAGTVDAPYYPGALSPINAAGDPDAGGRDDVAATIEGAVAAATDRWHEFQSGTYGEGSTYGDLMDLTPVDSAATPAIFDPSSGTQPPSGSFL